MSHILPSQILYLEHGDARLYAEAIQVTEARHLCWARPMLLVKGLSDAPGMRQQAITTAVVSLEGSPLELYDLCDAPDLIWPAELFQIAIDVDCFSLLVHLKLHPASEQRLNLRPFNLFVSSFWRTHAESFQSISAAPSSKL
ncbi:hypothetical protein IQ241_04800 [Romeria aff. gracilis LEGE 07310]|uniref:Uncharacterized protein n=1 Tax=Vasconcelosia minhoensis LEGE 07310 TaxID=915328 RepID=A0A8J7AJP8_9CYAN|nr:hypothetical protein [Romeria gracilis]MBE9076620.1 hypothetical protein [Romeria aff. gracilis LEGE 07310]